MRIEDREAGWRYQMQVSELMLFVADEAVSKELACRFELRRKESVGLLHRSLRMVILCRRQEI